MAGASWAALAFASCRSDSAVAFRSFATSAGCGWTLLDAAQPIARAVQMRKIQFQALGANTALLDKIADTNELRVVWGCSLAGRYDPQFGTHTTAHRGTANRAATGTSLLWLSHGTRNRERSAGPY